MRRARILRRRFDPRDRLQTNKIQSAVRSQAAAIAGQARETLAQGKETLLSLEDALERHVRANSRSYLIAAVAMASLLLLKALFDRAEE